MKKLEKLKLHDVKEISADEQKALKGGGEWTTAPNGEIYWCPGEVISYDNGTYAYAVYGDEHGETKTNSISLMEFSMISSGSWAAGSAGLAVGGPIGAAIGFWATAIGLYIGSSQD